MFSVNNGGKKGKPTFDTVHLDNFRNIKSSMDNIQYMRDRIEVTAIDGVKKISIRSPHARVHSQMHKRLELTHINSVVDSINIIPDFGFQNNVMNKDDLRCWNLFRDFI
jgi:hypothetical protein